MGVNICVYKMIEPSKFERIPEEKWDWLRQGWDRNFKFETETDFVDDGDPYSGFILSRPKDISIERSSLSRIPDEYRSRYDGLLDLLENNPDYWVHWSY